MPITKNILFLKKLVLLSLVLIYLVILAGGIVRSTGSGMGCPDWPRCFGQWVPPTDISQLPSDYKVKFKVGHHIIADFSPVKTWVEYVNRLLGVLVGISVFATSVFAFRFLRTTKSELFWWSLLIVILTGFQGWIGAKVVATNLSKYMITIHMLIALVIVAFTLYLLSLLGERIGSSSGSWNHFGLLLCGLTLLQILIGTQVRQEVDTIAIQYHDTQREAWIGQLGRNYLIHRFIAFVVIVANIIYSYYLLKRIGSMSLVSKLWLGIIVTLCLEYLCGVIMARIAIPYFVQPIHLLLATVVFGLQFFSWLLIKNRNLHSLQIA